MCGLERGIERKTSGGGGGGDLPFGPGSGIVPGGPFFFGKSRILRATAPRTIERRTSIEAIFRGCS